VKRERKDSLIVVNPLYLIHSFPAPNLALLSFASSRSRKKSLRAERAILMGTKFTKSNDSPIQTDSFEIEIEFVETLHLLLFEIN
jgi:hypothetical protein